MDDQRQSSPDSWPIFFLRRADQLCVAVILTACFGFFATNLWWQGALRGRLIEIEKAERREVQFQVNVNSAEWPELAMLPGVGETLARRIVEYREQHGPFASVEDLRRVSGVGPRSLDKMRPHLIALPADTAVAEQLRNNNGVPDRE